MKLAVPSETDACLDSMRSGHFGHTPWFTIVDIQDGQVVSATPLKNVDHDAVGCGGVIDFMLQQDIDGILTVGMGMPPYTRFTNGGVKVYTDGTAPYVGQAVQLFIEGKVPEMRLDQACRH